MQPPGRGRAARTGQERKYIAGKPDATEHQGQHIRQQQHIHRRLEDAQAVVSPLTQRLEPMTVQNMVGNEQQEHPGPNPFMGQLAGDRVAHQRHQQSCHKKINGNLPFLFWFHRVGPLF